MVTTDIARDDFKNQCPGFINYSSQRPIVHFINYNSQMPTEMLHHTKSALQKQWHLTHLELGFFATLPVENKAKMKGIS